MVVREVLEVLYSPVKAFKKIIEKPDFKGVLLILVLFMSFAVVEQYVYTSKLFLQTVTPDEDDWTESLSNQHNWTSNGSPSLDETDYKTGNSAGNHSVKSLVFNDTSIWMKITDIDPLDCSEDTGYKELFFWINWTHSNEAPSSNATLRLFSGSESSYFELDLTDLISTSSGEWKNATVPLGPESQGWDSIDSDWKTITGLEFRLVWPAPANLTLQIDDLHFQKYVSPAETGAFTGAIILILMLVAIPFLMNWILWSGILLLVAKVFREEVGSWTVFFVIIGHAFVVNAVYTLASAALLSTLPAFNVPLTVGNINVLSREIWGPYLAYQVWLYLPLVAEIWIAVLCAIAIRLLRGITWRKAASISVVAFVIRFILRFFGV